MEEHEATFEVESKTGAYAVERSLDRLYDSLREESRTIREGCGDPTEMLAPFEMVRDAARSVCPGRVTVVYEQRDEGFEGGTIRRRGAVHRDVLRSLQRR